MTIRENLLALIAAIEAHPETRLNLARFVKHTDCGTIYCAVGLAASIPFFRDQMPELEEHSIGVIADEMSDNEEMWGPEPFCGLFDTWYAGEYDEQLPQDLTDKELALARLRLRLEDYPA